MKREKIAAKQNQIYGMDGRECGGSLETEQPMPPYNHQGHGGVFHEQPGQGRIHEVSAQLHDGPAELGNSPVNS